MTRAIHRKAAWAAIPALALALAFGATQPSEAQAACKNVGKGTHKLNLKEARKVFRCVVNRKRTGRRNLKLHNRLNRAAHKHTKRMARTNCFSHQCPGEPNLKRRVRKTGYFRGTNRRKVGEVIALNLRKAKLRSIVRMWMRSPPHRRILLGSYRHMGVGVVTKGRRAYFTIVVGKR